MGNTVSQNELNTLLILKKIICIPSIICLFILIILFWFFRETRGFGNEMVIWLAILEIFYELSLLLPYYYDNPHSGLCATQAFLVNLFLHSRYFWMSVIGYCSISNILKQNYLEKHHLFFRAFFFCISIPIPLTLSLIILLTNSYGNAGAYCLYSYDSDNRRFFNRKIQITFLNARLLEMILLIFIIAKIMVLISKMKKLEKYKENDNEHFKYYLMIGVSTSMISCINISIQLISEKPFTYLMHILQLFSTNGEGILILIVFILTPGLRHSIISIYQNLTRQQLESESLFDDSQDRLYPSLIGNIQNNSGLDESIG